MTYQGERARPIDDENKRVFEVSSIRLDAEGRVSAVLWDEVDRKSNRNVGGSVVVPVVDVVDAIHDGAEVAAMFSTADAQLPERWFVVLEHHDGRESVVLGGTSTPGRDLADMAKLP